MDVKYNALMQTSQQWRDKIKQQLVPGNHITCGSCLGNCTVLNTSCLCPKSDKYHDCETCDGKGLIKLKLVQTPDGLEQLNKVIDYHVDRYEITRYFDSMVEMLTRWSSFTGKASSVDVIVAFDKHIKQHESDDVWNQWRAYCIEKDISLSKDAIAETQPSSDGFSLQATLPRMSNVPESPFFAQDVSSESP